MKTKNFFIILILVIVVGLFFISYSALNITDFHKLDYKMANLVKTFNALELELFKVRQQKEKSYDLIDEYFTEFQQVALELDEDFIGLKISQSSYLEKNFDALQIKIEELTTYLNEFKSSNSSLNVSLRFLIIRYKELPTALAESYRQLFDEIMEYILFPKTPLKMSIESQIKNFRALSTEGDDFLDHSEIIIAESELSSIITNSILMLKIDETIEDLQLTAQVEYERLVHNEADQKGILKYLSFGLLIYILYIIYKLGRTTIKVRQLNEDLELRVQERTKDLLDANKIVEQEKEKALAGLKTKSDFLANMSHEIRTPMNAILGFATLMGKTELNPKQKEYLRTILTSGDLLIGIINDILDYSKLNSGKIELENKPFDLEVLSFDMFKMCVNRLKNRFFDTYIDICDDVPRFISGDSLRLKQILVNLVGNALKFTQKGSVGLLIEMVKTDKDFVTLRFKVKDTGIGIPADKVDKIFESFSQADESTTRKYGGTGLGLAITKQLIERMGGSIQVDSIESVGSCFSFEIPFRKVSDSDQQQESRDTLLAQKTTFIVDDNKTSLGIMRKCCEKLEMKVLGIADSPQSALQNSRSVVS